MFRRSVALAALALAAPSVLGGCSSSHRLGEVAVEGRRVAVTAAIPPAPRVQVGSPAEAGVDPYDPIGSAVRVTTALDKRREVRRAQARLDSVVAAVDVADRVARRALALTARALDVTPAARPDASDFVLDVRVEDYALVADSFEGAVYFVLLGEARLLDGPTGRVLWDAELAEREVLSRAEFGALFGLPPSVGNVITGRQLAGLPASGMATGLGRLADLVADRIAAELVDDYRGSRDDYRRGA